jgi:hypothetical protein
MRIAYLSPFMAIAAYLAPPEVIEPAARVLVPGVALMATGVFPCMTLAVNAMKGEHRTPALVEDLYLKLRQLLKLLAATFILAIAAMALMAAGVGLLKAPVLTFVPKMAFGLAAAVIVLLVGRLEAIGRAFFVLLDINRKHALLIARAKIRGERDSAIDAGTAARVPNDDQTPRPLRRTG